MDLVGRRRASVDDYGRAVDVCRLLGGQKEHDICDFFGGGDPVDAVRLYGERIRHLHLKDVLLPVLQAARRDGVGFLAAVRRGVFCELGNGAVDLNRVIQEMSARGYTDWAIVEQDVDTRSLEVNPLESAIRSRKYLRNVIGI